MPVIISKIMRSIILIVASAMIVAIFFGASLCLLPFAGLFYYVASIIQTEIKEEESSKPIN